jgi:cobalt-precorrin-5B (C1)-methyltransferase
MIARQAEEAAQKASYHGGLSVTVSIPEGEKLAEKTFNPRLGIEGGLSVLGTSGIVRPMSEAALVDTIRAQLNQCKSEGAEHLLLSPGSYGAEFCRSALGLELEGSVQCSNYIGETLDYAALLGFSSLLLVGHVGKLVKVAAGVMNTHSRVADARLETLAAHAALSGASRETVGQMMRSVTTDAALDILKEERLLEPVMESVTAAIGAHLRHRGGERMQVEAIVFSNAHGLLGQTPGAAVLSQAFCAAEPAQS